MDQLQEFDLKEWKQIIKNNKMFGMFMNVNCDNMTEEQFEELFSFT